MNSRLSVTPNLIRSTDALRTIGFFFIIACEPLKAEICLHSLTHNDHICLNEKSIVDRIDAILYGKYAHDGDQDYIRCWTTYIQRRDLYRWQRILAHTELCTCSSHMLARGGYLYLDCWLGLIGNVFPFDVADLGRSKKALLLPFIFQSLFIGNARTHNSAFFCIAAVKLRWDSCLLLLLNRAAAVCLRSSYIYMVYEEEQRSPCLLDLLPLHRDSSSVNFIFIILCSFAAASPDNAAYIACLGLVWRNSEP